MLSCAENVTWLAEKYTKQAPKQAPKQATKQAPKQAPKQATKWVFDLVDLLRQPHGCKQITSLQRFHRQMEKFISNSHKFHKPHKIV